MDTSADREELMRSRCLLLPVRSSEMLHPAWVMGLRRAAGRPTQEGRTRRPIHVFDQQRVRPHPRGLRANGAGRRPQFRLLAKYIHVHKTVRTDTDRARYDWL